MSNEVPFPSHAQANSSNSSLHSHPTGKHAGDPLPPSDSLPPQLKQFSSTNQQQQQSSDVFSPPYKPPPTSSTGASAFNNGGSTSHKRFHSSGSGSGPSTFQYHPRQPGPASDSYFSGALPPVHLSHLSAARGGQRFTNGASPYQPHTHYSANSSAAHSRTVSSSGNNPFSLVASSLAHEDHGGVAPEAVAAALYSSQQQQQQQPSSQLMAKSYSTSHLSLNNGNMDKHPSLPIKDNSAGAEMSASTTVDGNNGTKDVFAGGPAGSLPPLNLSGRNGEQGPASASANLNRSSTFAGALSSLGLGGGPASVSGPAVSGHSRVGSMSAGVGALHGAGANSALHSAHPVSGPLGPFSAHPGHAGGSGRPPSPSTLTDVILGLHATLYGGKRKPEQVRQMVERYYESGAVFESPLLSAHGREQIANQFIMAFSLPGLDVRSELRDVICSDFEFGELGPLFTTPA